MPFCASCGAPVEGQFCPKCGAPAGADAGAGAPVPPPPPASAGSTGMSENVASALCYVLGLITGILFLVLSPYNQNKTIRFHAFQSIFLHVACILTWFVLAFVLHAFLLFLSPLIMLGFFVLWIVLIVKAYQGQKLKLPLIGPLAEQQA